MNRPAGEEQANHALSTGKTGGQNIWQTRCLVRQKNVFFAIEGARLPSFVPSDFWAKKNAGTVDGHNSGVG